MEGPYTTSPSLLPRNSWERVLPQRALEVAVWGYRAAEV